MLPFREKQPPDYSVASRGERKGHQNRMLMTTDARDLILDPAMGQRYDSLCR